MATGRVPGAGDDGCSGTINWEQVDGSRVHCGVALGCSGVEMVLVESLWELGLLLTIWYSTVIYHIVLDFSV